MTAPVCKIVMKDGRLFACLCGCDFFLPLGDNRHYRCAQCGNQIDGWRFAS